MNDVVKGVFKNRRRVFTVGISLIASAFAVASFANWWQGFFGVATFELATVFLLIGCIFMARIERFFISFSIIAPFIITVALLYTISVFESYDPAAYAAIIALVPFVIMTAASLHRFISFPSQRLRPWSFFSFSAPFLLMFLLQ